MKAASSGLDNRPAVDQHDDVAPHLEGGLRPGVDLGRAVRQLERRLRADRAAGGQPQVADDDVGAGLGHGRGLVRVEDIGGGQHVLGVGGGDHVDLQPVGHAGFLEIGAEGAVDDADGREILHARRSPSP